MQNMENLFARVSAPNYLSVKVGMSAMLAETLLMIFLDWNTAHNVFEIPGNEV